MTMPDQIEDQLLKAPEPDWVRQMTEHFEKEGWYRPIDLWRLLGDPSEGIEVQTDENAIVNLVLKQEKEASE